MPYVDSQTVKEYMDRLRVEFPKLEISDKRPWWLRFVFKLPGIKKLYWNNATQAIGMNIWLSDRWNQMSPFSKLSVLRHERQHLIWFRRHTTILAAFLYLLVFFPIGLAYYRARFERAGYQESVRTRVQYFGASQRVKDDCWEMYKRVFTGWMYLKMWPFPKRIRKWFEEDWAEAVRMHG